MSISRAMWAWIAIGEQAADLVHQPLRREGAGVEALSDDIRQPREIEMRMVGDPVGSEQSRQTFVSLN